MATKGPQFMDESSSATTFMNEVNEKSAKAEKEKQLKQQRASVDQRILDLEAKMFEFAETNGVEHFTTQLMISLHEVALQMKEMMNIMDAVTVSFSFVTETLNLFNQSIQFQDELISETLTFHNGPIARLKSAIKQKRLVRSMNNTMIMMGNRIAALSNMSIKMTNSLQGSVQKMQIAMAKNNAKQAKKNGKVGGAANVTPTESKTMELLRAHMAEKNGTPIEKASAPEAAPSNPDGGFDDIL